MNDVVSHQNVYEIESGGIFISVGPAAVNDQNIAGFDAMAKAAGDMDPRPGTNDGNLEKFVPVRRQGWLVKLAGNPQMAIVAQKILTSEQGHWHGGIMKFFGGKYKDL
ncbi:hypothetical protein J3R74_000682 [Puniceicoccus vermicola]